MDPVNNTITLVYTSIEKILGLICMSDLFRKKSLERLSSPERLDTTLKVESNRSWILVSGLAIITLSIVIWSVWAQIPNFVHGNGVFMRGAGLEDFNMLHNGFIKEVYVKENDIISPGDTVFTIIDTNGKEVPIKSLYMGGRVVEVLVNEHEIVHPGTVGFTLEQLNNPLQAIIYTPASESATIAKDMDVQITLPSFPPEKNGVIIGKVKSVSNFPVSNKKLETVFKGSSIESQFASMGPTIEVNVQLFPDKDDDSGYKWSTKQGARVKLHSGLLCSGKIVTGKQRPISMILPIQIGTEKERKSAAAAVAKKNIEISNYQ